MVNVLTQCYTKEDSFVTRRIAGETLVVPLSNDVGDLDAIYTLNEVGTLIWEQIDGQTELSQVVEALCRDYDVRPEEAVRDVLDFIKALEAAGMIGLPGESER